MTLGRRVSLVEIRTSARSDHCQPPSSAVPMVRAMKILSARVVGLHSKELDEFWTPSAITLETPPNPSSTTTPAGGPCDAACATRCPVTSWQSSRGHRFRGGVRMRRRAQWCCTPSFATEPKDSNECLHSSAAAADPAPCTAKTDGSPMSTSGSSRLTKISRRRSPLLTVDDIVFVHARNVLSGCYSFTVERGDFRGPIWLNRRVLDVAVSPQSARVRM